MHYLVSLSHRFDSVVEGEPAIIVKDGKFYYKEYKKLLKAQDEFFPELRCRGVNHLGQVKMAILEDSGDISVFYYDNNDVIPGLPIMPWVHDEKLEQVKEEGLYSCFNCGETRVLKPGIHVCPTCEQKYWVRSESNARVE